MIVFQINGEYKMKNKLSALIAAGALLGVSAAAYADVKVYGSVEQIIQHTDNGTTSSWDLRETGSNYIGFKATEDLGNGLSAFYNLYFTMSAEQQVGTITQWDNYVGLKGDFGQVRLGRMNSPTKQLGEDFANQFQIGNTLLDSENFGRDNNTVEWKSPNVGGLYGAVAITIDGTAGETGSDVMEYMVGYNYGPIEARAAFRNDKAGNDKGTAYGVKAQVSDDLRLLAAWNEVKTDGGSADEGWSAMADYKVANNNLRVGYQDSIRNQDMTTFEVEHFFTKTTSAFAYHQIASPESGAADTKYTGLGMRMKF